MHQNYKVFIKDKLLIFTENINLQHKEKHAVFYRYQGMKLLVPEFERFIRSRKHRTLIIYRKKNVDKLFNNFRLRFKQVNAAGGAVISKRDEVLMIHRHGRWDLPKGKKDQGEKNKECAIREVMEETGIEGIKITTKLQVTYHFFRRNKRLIIKKTHWYLMRAKRKQELVPAIEEGILKVKWIPYEQARKKSHKAFRSVTEVLCKAINCSAD